MALLMTPLSCKIRAISLELEPVGISTTNSVLFSLSSGSKDVVTY